jgi:hypothetical protein
MRRAAERAITYFQLEIFIMILLRFVVAGGAVRTPGIFRDRCVLGGFLKTIRVPQHTSGAAIIEPFSGKVAQRPAAPPNP